MALCKSSIEFNRLRGCSFYLRNRLTIRNKIKRSSEVIAARKSGIGNCVIRVPANSFLEVLPTLECALRVISFNEVTPPQVGFASLRIRCWFVFQSALHLGSQLDSYLTGNG